MNKHQIVLRGIILKKESLILGTALTLGISVAAIGDAQAAPSWARSGDVI